MYGRHPLVVNDRHGEGSVFRSARHGDFALFKMIFFGVSGGGGPHQGGGPGPILNFEPRLRLSANFFSEAWAIRVARRFPVPDHGDEDRLLLRNVCSVGLGRTSFCQSGRRASSSQRPFGFAVGGHDHADRNRYSCPEPRSCVDADEFLSGCDGTLYLAPDLGVP